MAWWALSFLILMVFPLSGGAQVLENKASALNTGIQAEIASKSESACRPNVVNVYPKLPLSFEANRGQTDPEVKFLARGSGYSLFLTSTEAVLALRESAVPGAPTKTPLLYKAPDAQPRSTTRTVLRMKLVGANSPAAVVGLDELPGKVNYFLGNDPKKWRTRIPTYQRVAVRAVYPGINLVYSGNQRQLEYDFIVAPGADPNAIKLAFEGARKLGIDAHGDLIVDTGGREIRQHRPFIYQENNGVKQIISGRFVLQGKQQVGFQVSAYDASKSLIIDPIILSYNTFWGGSGEDRGLGIAADSSGDVYVTGATGSSDFPTTVNALQPTFGGGPFDAFVTKISGLSVVYSTFLGGNNFDGANGITVDTAGNAYVAGFTFSSNFPTTAGAFQPNLRGIANAFVTKVNSTGDGLVYSTLLGGSNFDVGNGITVDGAGNAYVTGATSSSNFPTISGGFQPTFGGAVDGFVVKLSSDGSNLSHGNFLGGSDIDQGASIAVDTLGNTYVTGTTSSSNFPTTPGAFQTTFGGATDAFVAKVSADGGTLIYASFLGGSGNEQGAGIAVDAQANAYLTGTTNSQDFGTTFGAFQTASGGGFDAYVTKVSPDGSALAYSSYLGGPGDDRGNGITVDAMGNASLAGSTNSTTFPTTMDAIQPNYGGGQSDGFVSILDATGSILTYSTYFGGSGDDAVTAVAADPNGNISFTGVTNSPDLMTKRSAQSTFGGGNSDAFVGQIALGPCNYSPGTCKCDDQACIQVDFELCRDLGCSNPVLGPNVSGTCRVFCQPQ